MNKHPEQKIQHQIINWCRENGLKVYGTANGQFLNSWNGLRERATLGRGLPDLFILIPDNRSITSQVVMICCEVKSEKGCVKPEQKEFLDLVNKINGGVYGAVVHSLEDAVMYLIPMLAPKPELTDSKIESLIHSL